MEDFGTLWDDYSINFCKTLEYKENGDWSKLDEEEQEIAALWKLYVDMYNGGFIQFFCNWGFPGYWYAMRGLQRMEDFSLLNLLHNTYMKVLEKFKEDPRLQEYWDIPEYLTEEDTELLEETDKQFYDREGEVFAKTAYQFYCKKLNKVPRN